MHMTVHVEAHMAVNTEACKTLLFIFFNKKAVCVRAHSGVPLLSPLHSPLSSCANSIDIREL